MKGLLKTKSAGSQFLLLVGITLVSLFVVTLIGTLILTAVSGIDLKQLVEIRKIDFSKPNAITFIRGMQIVQFFSLFVVPVTICAYLFSNEPKKYLGLKKPWHSGYFFAGIGIMLLAVPFSILLGELNKNIPFPSGMADWMKKSEDEASEMFRALLNKQTITDLILNIICIAGLAAVGEELLFRGMAQRLLIKMFKSPWAGIIISAILFSAMHMQFYGFLQRLALGILLGAIYWYSGSLWPAMLAHFLYDAIAILITYFNPESMNEGSTWNLSVIMIIAFAFITLLILTLAWMKKKSQTSFSAVYGNDAIPVKDHPF
jgi:membrane protease YdiL (CAAX protease family)